MLFLKATKIRCFMLEAFMNNQYPDFRSLQSLLA